MYYPLGLCVRCHRPCVLKLALPHLQPRQREREESLEWFAATRAFSVSPRPPAQVTAATAACSATPAPPRAPQRCSPHPLLPPPATTAKALLRTAFLSHLRRLLHPRGHSSKDPRPVPQYCRGLAAVWEIYSPAAAVASPARTGCPCQTNTQNQPKEHGQNYTVRQIALTVYGIQSGWGQPRGTGETTKNKHRTMRRRIVFKTHSASCASGLAKWSAMTFAASVGGSDACSNACKYKPPYKRPGIAL